MSKTPFEMAIAVHEDRYGSLQTSASRWRLVALSLLGLLALCIVLPETHAQEELVRRVMAMVASGSAAAAKATAFYQELADTPDRRRTSIDCQVKAVLPMAEDTWQVDWSEHRYESGSLVGTKHFKAVVTVDVEPTRAMARVLANPLGIYVVDFHVTELG